ncbi:MAG: flagellar biosynthesis protein FlhF, partial [Legionella sp.]
GGALSALIESGLPVSYLTHGQRVPEDIKMATRHQLVELFAQQEIQLFPSPQQTEAREQLHVGRELYV